MFTGIVEAVGSVREVSDAGGSRRFVVEAPFAGELKVGESVAVQGACMTVTDLSADAFAFTTVEESLAKTTLGALSPGDGVNLERALRMGGRLDGHLVQGHVDATGEIVRAERLEGSHLFAIAYPPAWQANLIPTGSVAVDGISLTTARLDDAAPTFTVAIIPHTFQVTTAGRWREGARVNLEFDLIGKYALRRG
jgi:riboflavin synthase